MARTGRTWASTIEASWTSGCIYPQHEASTTRWQVRYCMEYRCSKSSGMIVLKVHASQILHASLPGLVARSGAGSSSSPEHIRHRLQHSFSTVQTHTSSRSRSSRDFNARECLRHLCPLNYNISSFIRECSMVGDKHITSWLRCQNGLVPAENISPPARTASKHVEGLPDRNSGNYPAGWGSKVRPKQSAEIHIDGVVVRTECISVSKQRQGR